MKETAGSGKEKQWSRVELKEQLGKWHRKCRVEWNEKNSWKSAIGTEHSERSDWEWHRKSGVKGVAGSGKESGVRGISVGVKNHKRTKRNYDKAVYFTALLIFILYLCPAFSLSFL